MGRFFEKEHIAIIDDSLHVSEELVSDFFSVTKRHWLKNPYEVFTLNEINAMSVFDEEQAFAHLLKYTRPVQAKKSGRDNVCLYRICLNDARILDATGRAAHGRLFPFLVYILTHELSHIIRFSKYHCGLDVYDRMEEEIRVHAITREILSHRKINGINPVIEFFRKCVGDTEQNNCKGG